MMKKITEGLIQANNINKKLNSKLYTSLIEKIIKILVKSIRSRGKIIFCGNGGSASDSLHLTAELIGRFKKKRKAISAISLNSEISTITAIANDFGYEKIFSEQIKIKGKRGDLLICLSGSGNSSNIIYAIKEANRQSMTTFCFLGYDGGNAKSKTKHFFHFKDSDMQHAEDSQILINHICSKWLKINL